MLNARLKAFYLCNSFLLIAAPISVYHKSRNTTTTPLEKSNDEMPALVTEVKKHNIEPAITLNNKEAVFVRKYIKYRGDCLVNVKKRSIIPFDIIDSVFRIYHIPVELKYLAVIESELKPTALSHVGARGPWQLMPATAKVLGLKVNTHIDERTNFILSTKAAARYLKDLYAQFDDWLLVIAAYNGGPKPVYTAMRESGSKNFWVIQQHLPAESREHVKKFIATHYYFEGHGSETTLTRSEYMNYIKQVNTFDSEQKTTKLAPVETSEQKFQRVMKESEESLKKSGKFI
jgi:membrane-bound lytic murein transglycosylase D